MQQSVCQNGTHRVIYKDITFKFHTAGDTDITFSEVPFKTPPPLFQRIQKQQTIHSWSELLTFAAGEYTITATPPQDYGQLLDIVYELHPSFEAVNPLSAAALLESIYWSLVTQPRLTYPIRAHKIGDGNWTQTAFPGGFLVYETS